MSTQRTASSSPLAGLRVLVVEDELMIAMLIEDMLVDEACNVVGPCSTIADALAAAIPADRPGWLACSKPFTALTLTGMLAGLVAPARG